MSTWNPCIVAATLVCGFISSLPAQNMTLIKSWRRTSTSRFNDIWGWTSPTGREFAYVGERGGIWFVETTDPNNIKQIGYWTSPSSTWRDFTNYKQYVYSVSESRLHRGIRVMDMSNPDAPKDLGYVATANIAYAHNISVDPDTGHLYVSGSNQGVAIFDASKTPANPTLVAAWKTPNPYVHDACIRRGRAYFALGYSRKVRILNATNVTSMTTIADCPTPGRYCHNVWVSEDDQLLVVTDEIAFSGQVPHVTVWDISNVSSPVKKGDYIASGNYGVHNAFSIGRTGYLSHYLDGVHMIDLADPTKPSLLARYDTSTRASGYNGCWGVYPFSDSGLIYACDMDNGLFVLQADCGHMNRYEKGTPGSNGLVPRARFDGASPKYGASKLEFKVENLQPNANFVFLISLKPAKLTILGVQVNVDLASTLYVYLKADANGKATIPTPVPSIAGPANAKVYFQIVSEDKGNPLGFSASRGMWTGICK